jgi:hypothetical protein
VQQQTTNTAQAASYTGSCLTVCCTRGCFQYKTIVGENQGKEDNTNNENRDDDDNSNSGHGSNAIVAAVEANVQELVVAEQKAPDHGEAGN